jgi:glutamine synthetase
MLGARRLRETRKVRFGRPEAHPFLAAGVAAAEVIDGIKSPMAMQGKT